MSINHYFIESAVSSLCDNNEIINITLCLGGCGSIPVKDSDFFFVPCSCHVYNFIFITFITELKIHHHLFH